MAKKDLSLNDVNQQSDSILKKYKSFIKTFIAGFLLATVLISLSSLILFLDNNNIYLYDNSASIVANSFACAWLGVALGQYFAEKEKKNHGFDVGILIAILCWYLVYLTALYSNPVYLKKTNNIVIIHSFAPFYTVTMFIVMVLLIPEGFFKDKEDIQKILDILKDFSKEGLTVEFIIFNVLIPFILSPDIENKIFFITFNIILLSIVSLYIIFKIKKKNF